MSAHDFTQMRTAMATATDPLLKMPEVENIVGLKRAMIYRLVKAGKFPKPWKPGGYASRWLQSEVMAWREQWRQ